MPTNTNVLIIRHAEKPADHGDPTLAVAGQARAQAYVVYFQNFSVNSTIVKLDYLFAAADTSDSHRPRLTLEPLATALGLAIDHKHKDKDYSKVADHIRQNSKYDNANILICWHHGEILPLAEALGAAASSLPSKWPEDVYGWLLRLAWDSAEALDVAPAINQQLMYDDYGNTPPPPSTT